VQKGVWQQIFWLDALPVPLAIDVIAKIKPSLYYASLLDDHMHKKIQSYAIHVKVKCTKSHSAEFL